MMDRKKIRWNGWGWAERSNPLANDEKSLVVARHGEAWRCVPALHARARTRKHPRCHNRNSLQEKATPNSFRFSVPNKFATTITNRAFHALGRSYFDLLRLRAGDLHIAPDAVALSALGEAG